MVNMDKIISDYISTVNIIKSEMGKGNISETAAFIKVSEIGLTYLQRARGEKINE